MPSILAFVLTVVFIVFLFRRDFREKPNVTSALWIPILWFLIIGSRTVTAWLDLCGVSVGGSLEDGSPADATVYFALIVAGLCVLKRRRINLGEILRNNRLIAAFLIYCLVSIFWSDFPLVSFKRWIKILGHPIMALIIFTEPDPEEALIRLMKRCAYVLVPVSILFIKYFPQWGRGYEQWTGESHDTGVTTNKNDLGCDCLIFSFFFFWCLLKTWNQKKSPARRNELLLCGGFLIMTLWLLKTAHSSTSLVSLGIAMAMVLFLGLRFVNRRLVGVYVVTGIVVLIFAEATFGIFSQALQILGKDPTLTDRTLLWHEVLKIPINPVFGAGFESFWLGDRLKKLWDIYWWHPIQAHNGYLETYLNLGLVGLALMIGLIISTFRKGSRMLLDNFEFARFRLGFLAAFVFYNWTEAAIKALHPVWFVFYLIAMDYPKPQVAPSKEFSLDEEPEAAKIFTP
jgi:exopolysaccharide production protein ExoQ